MSHVAHIKPRIYIRDGENVYKASLLFSDQNEVIIRDLSEQTQPHYSHAVDLEIDWDNSRLVITPAFSKWLHEWNPVYRNLDRYNWRLVDNFGRYSAEVVRPPT